MARRGQQNPAEEPTPTETVETAVEAPEETVTEAPAEAAVEADLTPFKDAATAALAEADPNTGDLPESAIESVNKVYRDIDGVKGKNAARSFLEDEMKKAILGKDILKARAFVGLKDGLSAGSGGGTKTPADPTVAFVQRVAALRIASTLVETSVPEGVGEDWSSKVDDLVSELSEQVDTYQAWTQSTDEDAEQPEVSPVVRQAFKLSAGKGSGGGGSRTSGGPRRDIEKHLQQVFAELPVGSFLTVNEIAKASSTEYGDDRPSAGAVSARLFPKGKAAYSANGIEATADEGKSRGATKTA